MKVFFMLFLAVAFLAAVDPVDPAAAPAQLAPVAQTVKPKKPKKVCRDLGEGTGSHMSQRLCLTEEEWALRDQQGKSMEDLRTMGRTH